MQFSRYEEALLMAAIAHKDQKRWNGDPYITHLIRVAGRVRILLKDRFTSGWIETHLVVAILHDSVEDEKVTLDQIKEKFGDIVAEAVDAVSRRKDESYSDFITRVLKNQVAAVVKMADLQDNTSDLPPDHGLWSRYTPAMTRVGDALEQWNII